MENENYDLLSLLNSSEDQEPNFVLASFSTEELEQELRRRRGVTGQSTVEEARAYLRERAYEGDSSKCPVCTRLDKRYHRPLNAGMARFVVWLWGEASDGRWVNVPTTAPKHILAKCRDFTLLRHWGLIEPRVNEDDSRSGSGDWRATPLLGKWLRGEVEVPSHIWIYQNDPVTLDSTNMIAAVDKLPEFDFRALMKG